MNHIENDTEYIQIVQSILYHEAFNKIKKNEHHGISRYEHSLRVSYYSYKFAHFCKLDYNCVARAGLLHDYFYSDVDQSAKERFLSVFTHPKKAVKNAQNVFGINKMEEDIIKSHMFPINLTVPKYLESWVVNFVDKIVGLFEFTRKFSYRFSYAVNLFLIFLINSGK